MFSLKRFNLNAETDKYMGLSHLLYIQAKRYSTVCYVTSQIWKAWQCCQYRHNFLGSVLFILIEVSTEVGAFIRLIILTERIYRSRVNT